MGKERGSISLNRREFLKFLAGISLANPDEILNYAELHNFLESIKEEKEKWLGIINDNDLFGDFKVLSKDQVKDDFEHYFPIYKAAEKKYGIDFIMLWVTHVQETTASRDNYPNKYPLKWAMQRNATFYKDDEPDQAGAGWEFLSLLRTRYDNDWKEIIWAAAKMEEDRRKILNNNPELIEDLHDLNVKTQMKYCARAKAIVRVERYEIIKELERQKRGSKTNNPV